MTQAQTTTNNDGSAIGARTTELFKEQWQNIILHTDRLCSWLMICQWLFTIGLAFWLSPRTWSGVNSQIHPHIWLAVFLGGIVTALPVCFAQMQPGKALTRHVIAAGQMLMSAVLIHITGGRIETHFHVFGSLAILSFYRDWRILITATLVVATDHLIRGIFWPESVYGVLSAPIWRTFEHAAWVIFEVTFLIIAIRKSHAEMVQVAERQAKLEAVNESIERTVAERTAQLTQENRQRLESQALYHSLVEQLPAGIFRKDTAGRYVFVNSWFCKLRGKEPGEILSKTPGELAPAEPDENEAQLLRRGAEHHQEILRTGRSIQDVEAHEGADGKVRHLQVIKTPVFGADGNVSGTQGILVDITALKEAEAKLKQIHQQLVDASRQAGMAEVATSVLHNVGNVLNSVNVSSSLIADKVRSSKVTSLGKVVALIRANENDLGNFFTNHPKGTQVTGFLSELAAHLAEEQEEILREAGALVNNIVHIKEIVSMQQSYAKISGIVESVKISDLVDDAMQMNNGSFDRHQVKVVRDFVEIPPILTEKHKVLQILVNLIRNAKHACDDSGRTDKQIVLRVANGNNRIKISVQDNGVGIAPENLTRIFSHGFTTRKEGHGFGLHSGALAAKDLGGSLAAFSEGPGRGAIFTLELPMKKSKDDV